MNTPMAIGQLSDLYATNPLAACKAALRRTTKLPWKDRLEVINSLLGMHGTEAIRGDWQNGYWCDTVAAYCNAGDAYAPTVIHVRGNAWNESGQFIVSSWGEWIEKNGKKYGVS